MFGQKVDDDARRHAIEAYPNESCGLVIGDSYVRVPNEAEDTKSHFKISVYSPDYRAVVHSHPEVTIDKPKYYGPSAADMIGQASSGIPWGVISTNGRNATPVAWFGDQVPIAPLVQRPFIHGVYDCYALVRDYYRLERGISIYNQPRDHEWWEGPEDYLSPVNFKRHGFKEYPLSQMMPGDGLVMTIMPGKVKKVNHCAVYLGNNLILHHLFGRPSKKDNLGPWLKMCYKSALRYEGQP